MHPPTLLLTEPRALVERTARPSPSRIAWVNVAKGLCIIQTVWYHVAHGLLNAGIGLGEPWATAHQYTHSYNVFTFFFLSGIFVRRSAAKDAPAYFATLGRCLVYPYFLWSLVSLASVTFAGSLANGRPDPLEVIGHIVSQPYLQYWFLYVLLILRVVYWFSARLRVPDAAMLAAGMGYHLLTRSDPPSLAILGRAASFLAPFALGSMVGVRTSGSPLPWPRWLKLAGALASGVLLSIASMHLVPVVGQVVRTSWLTGLIGCASLVLLAQALTGSRLGRVFAYVGEHTLEIYPAHVFGTAGARIVLLRVFHVEDGSLHCVVGLLAGVLFPLILAGAVDRLGLRFVFTLPPGRCSRPRVAV